MTTRARSFARLALILGGVAGLSLLTGAPAAFAASGVTVSVEDAQGNSLQTVTANSIVIEGSGPAPSSGLLGGGGSRTVQLSVKTPTDKTYEIGSDTVSGPSDERLSEDLTKPSWAPDAPAINGPYTFTFSNGSGSGETANVNVNFAIPPAVVQGFGAQPPDGTSVTFQWTANTEPDLIGYDIRESTGQDVTPDGFKPRVAGCDQSTSCSLTIAFGNGVRGTSHSFVITASRNGPSTSSAPITSANSAPVSVTFAADKPTTAPGGGSTAGGGSGGSSTQAGGTTGSTTSGSAASGSTGKSGSGATESAKEPAATLKAYLPTQLAGAAPDLPSVQTEVKPLPEGTYQPTLAYPDQTQTQAIKSPAPVAAQGVGHDITTALDKSALWRSLGAAVILLLIAGHLRAWVEQIEQFD